MGASFRNVSEIKELAGIDFLTISPNLLEDLQNSQDKVEQKLSVEDAGKAEPMAKVSYVDDEPKFRWVLLEEQMAFDKLHEGIKKVRGLHF
jgi:transaldolase